METHSFWAILRGILKRFFSYFLQGLLYIVPLAILAWAVYKVFNWLQEIVQELFPNAAGLGLVILLVGITVLGFAGTSILFRPIVRRVRALLDRAPLIKTIYTALSDLLSAFVGKKKTFNQPVLVRMIEGSSLEKLGFITQRDLSRLGIDGERVAVYLPHSFNFSGNLYIVPASSVTIIDAKAADVMKFIVSGGAVDLEKEVEDEELQPGDKESPNVSKQ